MVVAMIKLSGFLLLLLVATTGCKVANLPTTIGRDYERIDIIMGDDIYTGRILSHRDDIEVTKNGILLKPGARFAIKTLEVTEFLGQFDVSIISGQGVTAYLRTVPYQFDTTHGIAFRYAVDGCQLRYPDGRTIPLEYNAETETGTISLYNEAARLAVSVNCQQLYEDDTNLPGTEYVIFEPLPGSTVELRHVAYFNTDTE